MRAPALLVGLALMAVTTSARAIDPLACTEAAESGQRARAESKLRAAQTQFAVCQSQDCPSLVRQDCSKWAVEVAGLLPTIVIDARDATGRDLADVTVLVDREVLVATIDGKSVSIDPGPHVLTFEHAGSASVVQKVIIKEGMKGRMITVTFEDANRPPTPAPPPVVQRETTPSSGGHTAWPWVVVGVGGVAVVTGIVMIATAPSLPSGCRSDTRTCTQREGETPADYSERQDRASSAVNQPLFGALTAGVGAGIVGLGLLWHFLEPSASRASAGLRVAPWSTASSAGLAALGAF